MFEPGSDCAAFSTATVNAKRRQGRKFLNWPRNDSIGSPMPRLEIRGDNRLRSRSLVLRVFARFAASLTLRVGAGGASRPRSRFWLVLEEQVALAYASGWYWRSKSPS